MSTTDHQPESNVNHVQEEAGGRHMHLKMHSERFQELIQRGLIDPDDFDKAVRESHKTGEDLSKILVNMGLVEEDDEIGRAHV